MSLTTYIPAAGSDTAGACCLRQFFSLSGCGSSVHYEPSESQALTDNRIGVTGSSMELRSPFKVPVHTT